MVWYYLFQLLYWRCMNMVNMWLCLPIIYFWTINFFKCISSWTSSGVYIGIQVDSVRLAKRCRVQKSNISVYSTRSQPVSLRSYKDAVKRMCLGCRLILSLNLEIPVDGECISRWQTRPSAYSKQILLLLISLRIDRYGQYAPSRVYFKNVCFICFTIVL